MADDAVENSWDTLVGKLTPVLENQNPTLDGFVFFSSGFHSSDRSH